MTTYFFHEEAPGAFALVTPAGEDAARAAAEAAGFCVEVPPPGKAPGDAGAARAVLLPPAWRVSAGWTATPLRAAAAALGDGALLRALHVARWARESAFCGSCGAENTWSSVELARQCPACGRLEYPRIAPAVITLIENDEGQALLAHNRAFKNGVYSLIAGFVEAGETLEEAVAREIREEVGLEVQDIRYAASQPWPFPHSLMLGFYARSSGGEIRPDGVEIEDARWCSRDELPPLPGPGSIARRLIERWRAGEAA